MDALDSLRAFLADARPMPDRAEAALPAGELRFVLEYPGRPDPAAERAALAALLGSDRFVLRPLFADGDHGLDRFLVLAVPGAERAMRPEQLFAAADTLARARGLVSAEPDIGAEVFVEPAPPGERRPDIESAEALGRLCWVDVPEAEWPPHRWALENMRATAAWVFSPGKGRGVLVGQPDTGYARHDELEAGALRPELGTDVLDGDDSAEDPLREGVANPGHGTATASVVAGREAGRIAGAAPGAAVVPIRCIEDVKVFDAAPVAAAVDHARRVGCDVVSMSLGGVPGRALHAAIRAAVAEGMIVVAAAGNCVRVVVWPARYPEVLAVAGNNAADRPWRGSSRGSAVAITAPAELVWRAQRNRQADPTDLVGAGQGTSFSAALVAGAAALWLAHHGRDAVRAEARRRGTDVQTLFRQAMQATARPSSALDPDDFGPGIVDADALLRLPLDDVPAAALEMATGADVDEAESADVRSLVAEVMGGSRPAAAGFDWRRHGLEVASLLLADARRGRGPRDDAVAVESPRRAPQGASAPLRAAAAASPDPRLQALAGRRPRHRPAPLLLRPATASDPAAATRALRILGRPEGSPLESAATGSLETARRTLSSGATQRRRLDAVEKALAGTGARGGDDALRRDLLNNGPSLLSRLAAEGPEAGFTGDERAGLEALVALTDRPAVRIVNGTLDRGAPDIEAWLTPIDLALPDIERTVRSVGRIDLDGQHIGTGFVVAAGLVATNRHVLEAIATPVPRRRRPDRWLLDQGEEALVQFAESADDPARAFRIKGVAYAGPEPIEGLVKFGNLDLALLEVETTSGAGTALPEPLPFARDARKVRAQASVAVVGFPAMPVVGGDLFPGGVTRAQVVERLRAIYGLRYGVKYFSPGVVSGGLAADTGDPQEWVFDHDATTLGGNSGSAVVHFGDPFAVVGLHFAGDWMRANHAHGVAAVRERGEDGVRTIMDRWAWA